MRPTSEQQEAIELRGHDVFCEAGAGTGKTTVLVERFTEAIVTDGCTIGELLAFTFTDRAAEQLRHRIRRALRARAGARRDQGDTSGAAELDRLARDTEGAQITTIHGFCRRLLAAHPVAAGIDPRFRVLNEGEASRLQARAFTAAVEEVLTTGTAEQRAEAPALVAATGTWSLRSIVTAAHEEMRTRGHERPELPDLPERDPVELGRALAAAAEAALAECTQEGRKPSAKALEALGEAQAIGARAVGGEAATRLDLEGLGLSDAKSYQGEACDEYRRALGEATAAAAEAELAGAYALLQRLLVAFGRRYAELKDSRSGLDYEDLQLGAVALLASNAGIRESYAGRIRHLLVDEFQDTNPLQLRLVGLLSGPETRVFSVGDELQSIYGFRGADLEGFRRARERVAQRDDGQARVLPLRGNFRSQAPIIATVNQLGRVLIGESFAELALGSADQATGEGADAPVELLLTPTGRGKKDPWSEEDVGLERGADEQVKHSRIAEARLLARRLAELRAEGIDRSRMVVLLRSYTAVATYEQALSAAGLAPYVVGGRGYWSSQQVEDLLRLLGTIANPLDDESVLGALASSACGVSPDTLWLLRQIGRDRSGREGEERRSGRYWPTIAEAIGAESPPAGSEAERWAAEISEADRERLTVFREVIESLREQAPVLGIEATIAAACERTGYELATLMREGGAARWANARKLMRLAREFSEHEGDDLPAFLAYAADEAARAAEGEAPIAAEDHDGVRLMTIHGAKGLEFDVVAVPELGRNLATFRGSVKVAPDPSAEPEGDDGPSPVRVGLRLGRLGAKSQELFGLNELRKLAIAEEVAEELRLGHVAATRARVRLVLSGTVDPAALEKGPNDGAPIAERLVRGLGDGMLAERLAAAESSSFELELDPPAGPDGTQIPPQRLAVSIVWPQAGSGAALAAGGAETTPDEELPPPVTPPLLTLDAPPASGARLSYSALALYDRCGLRFHAERGLGLSREEPAAGAEGSPVPREIRFGFGNAVHRLLEWSARNRWAEPGHERAARVLRAEGLPANDEQVARAVESVAGWLASDLRGTISGMRPHPEAPFVLPLERTLIRGSIDLLAIEGDRALVVDYKTDRLGGADPADLASRYEIQRAIYALAAGSRVNEVETAYVFLERPGEPVVTRFSAADLEAERERLGRLIAGIDAGIFEVTPNPHRGLCHDCPAGPRLCPHPKEARLAAAPAGASDPEPGAGGQLSLEGT